MKKRSHRKGRRYKPERRVSGAGKDKQVNDEEVWERRCRRKKEKKRNEVMAGIEYGIRRECDERLVHLPAALHVQSKNQNQLELLSSLIAALLTIISATEDFYGHLHFNILLYNSSF